MEPEIYLVINGSKVKVGNMDRTIKEYFEQWQFERFLEMASREVRSWPEWKRNML